MDRRDRYISEEMQGKFRSFWVDLNCRKQIRNLSIETVKYDTEHYGIYMERLNINASPNPSTLTHFQDQLETEWWDIDNVFTAVAAIVEEARAAALRPVEAKRDEVLKEAKDIKEKLEAEIHRLEKTISELDNLSVLEDHVLFLQVSDYYGRCDWIFLGAAFGLISSSSALPSSSEPGQPRGLNSGGARHIVVFRHLEENHNDHVGTDSTET